MTTPSEPGASVPQEPPTVPGETAAQDAAAAAQAADAAQTDAIRELAAEIAKQAVLDFDPATIRKGVITAIADTAAPPTVSVQISGDTTTTIDGIRYIDSYAPVVGDTALIIKQGTDLVVLGEIAAQFTESGWTAAVPAAGFTAGGNSNGPLMYRRVWDNGSWKVQWKGAVTRASGTVVVAALPAGYRPVARVSDFAARDAGGGSNTVGVDFEASGAVNLTGTTTAPASATTGATDPGDTSSTGSHTHLVDFSGVGLHQHFYSHTHGITSQQPPPTTSTHHHGGVTASQNTTTTSGSVLDVNGNTAGNANHSHAMGTHTHTTALTVTAPVWVSFNGLEYFLD